MSQMLDSSLLVELLIPLPFANSHGPLSFDPYSLYLW